MRPPGMCLKAAASTQGRICGAGRAGSTAQAQRVLSVYLQSMASHRIRFHTERKRQGAILRLGAAVLAPEHSATRGYRLTPRVASSEAALRRGPTAKNNVTEACPQTSPHNPHTREHARTKPVPQPTATRSRFPGEQLPRARARGSRDEALSREDAHLDC